MYPYSKHFIPDSSILHCCTVFDSLCQTFGTAVAVYHVAVFGRAGTASNFKILINKIP